MSKETAFQARGTEQWQEPIEPIQGTHGSGWLGHRGHGGGEVVPVSYMKAEGRVGKTKRRSGLGRGGLTPKSCKNKQQGHQRRSIAQTSHTHLTTLVH